MKLFEIKDGGTLAFNQDTIEYLINAKGGSTLKRVRYLVANIYNSNTYPNVEIFSMLRNADEEHQELILNIIELCSTKYGEAVFSLVDNIAPSVIERLVLNKG